MSTKDLPPLDQVNWSPEGCDCEITSFRYVTTLAWVEGVENLTCVKWWPDGSSEDVPMQVSTIDAMAVSGKRVSFWANRREKQLETVALLDAEITRLRDLGEDTTQLEARRDAVAYGKVYVDDETFEHNSGMQTRGIVTKACSEHVDYMGARVADVGFKKACGCLVRQVGAGHNLEDGMLFEVMVEPCPVHAG